MMIFHSFVSLPEGKSGGKPLSENWVMVMWPFKIRTESTKRKGFNHRTLRCCHQTTRFLINTNCDINSNKNRNSKAQLIPIFWGFHLYPNIVGIEATIVVCRSINPQTSSHSAIDSRRSLQRSQLRIFFSQLLGPRKILSTMASVNPGWHYLICIHIYICIHI
jgi:hypothetical protein